MRNDLTPFRTVRELLANRDEVLMSNAVDTEGKLYDDSVENLTAILAMEQDYKDMLAALEAAYHHFLQHLERDWFDDDDHDAMQKMFDAITKAKGAAA